MKKISIFLLSFIFLLQQISSAAPKIANHLSGRVIGTEVGVGTNTGLKLDAAGEMLGYKFFAETTSAVTKVDLNLVVLGDLTGIGFTVEIQGDSSGVPDGVTLGAASAEFTPSATGWTGLQTLGTNSGNLTIGTPYWVVVKEGTGTPDATHYIQIRHTNVNYGNSPSCIRHHNATNWTTTAAVSTWGVFALEHSDSSYSGFAVTSNATTSGQTDIYSTNKQGIKTKFGSQVNIIGINFTAAKSGTPGNLTARIYAGSTLKASSNAIASTNIASSDDNNVFFNSPVLIAADADIYITLEQDGTSDANDYDLACITFPSAYREAVAPANYFFIYGSGNDPTTFTVSTTQLPKINFIFTDPATEFEETAGGGASIGWVGMSQ